MHSLNNQNQKWHQWQSSPALPGLFEVPEAEEVEGLPVAGLVEGGREDAAVVAHDPLRLPRVRLGKGIAFHAVVEDEATFVALFTRRDHVAGAVALAEWVNHDH